jgi:polysaccharide export outer membrane protein
MFGYRVGAQERIPPIKPAEPNSEGPRPALLSQTQPVPRTTDEYRIGPGDLIDINVLEAAELNRSLRVSASGQVSMPPLGPIKVGGLAPQEIEAVVRELLRRSIMNDPHVTVFVREMESHPVSVTGAVKKPGVFHISGPKTLLEVLSMAEGLADDAGTTALIMRGGATKIPPSGAATVEVNLKDLLNSHDPRFNVLVYPEDVVKVSRAGIVYVLGDVKKPGGFLIRNNEDISILQALALAEGLAPTSAKSQTRIIRTAGESGQHTEIPLDLGKIMQGKAPDTVLQPKDVVFVPKSGGKHAVFRTTELILSTVPGALVYRPW